MMRDEILAMKPGRELDALIYAMIHGGTIPREGDNRYDMMPCYSTDMVAAWQVVEKMIQKTGLFYLIHNDDNDDLFWCHFRNCAYEVCGTAPEAICKAALMIAIGKKADAWCRDGSGF